MGGPAVHISMMEEEVVVRRRWLTRSDFLDFLGGGVAEAVDGAEMAEEKALPKGGEHNAVGDDSNDMVW